MAHMLGAFLTLHLPGREVSLDNPDAVKIPFGVSVAVTVILFGVGHALERFETSLNSPMRTLRKILSETRGAEIAETAAVLPVLFSVLLAIFFFGRAYNIYGTITQAAQQGARAASGAGLRYLREHCADGRPDCDELRRARAAGFPPQSCAGNGPEPTGVPVWIGCLRRHRRLRSGWNGRHSVHLRPTERGADEHGGATQSVWYLRVFPVSVLLQFAL